MNLQTPSLLIFLFLSLPYFSKAVEIKEGQWVGISQKETSIGNFMKIEEWTFGKNTLVFKKYNNKYEPSTLSFSGKYQIDNNELIIQNESGELLEKFPISIQEDQIIITSSENSSKIFLYYNSKPSKPQDSIWESELSNHLFSISQPQLFAGANEIEFWDFASFYSKKQSAQCHHGYHVFQFGEQHFILFEKFPSLRIQKKEGNTFTVESISEKRPSAILNPINDVPLININDLAGKWKWKESGIKPNNINNHYTISIGYNMHILNIEKDGFIQWHTELYYDQIQEKDPFVIPDRIIPFLKQYFPNERKENESPFIKTSPSGRLIIFESFPMESSALNIGNNPIHHSKIKTLQFIEKSDFKILFKDNQNGKYVTLTKIPE